MQNGAFRVIGGKRYLLQPRDYVVQIAHDGTASSISQGIIQIDSGRDFLLYDRYMEDTNDPALVAPGLGGQYNNFVSLMDSSMNYTWSNFPVPRAGFARDRTEGYRLPEECLIAANTKITVTLTNPAAGLGAVAGTTTLVLQGYSLIEG